MAAVAPVFQYLPTPAPTQPTHVQGLVRTEQPLWNPGTALKIADYRTAHQVQCCGLARTRNYSRCGWHMRGPEAVPILNTLRLLASRSPAQVTDNELGNLARLCLCSDWHYDQWDRLVREWRPIIHEQQRQVQAAQINNVARMLIHAPPTPTGKIPAALALPVPDNIAADLEARNAELRSSQAAAEQRAQALSTRIDELEEQLSRMTVQESQMNKTHGTLVQGMHEQLRSAERRIEELLAEERQADVTYREQVKTLQNKLQTSQQTITTMKAQETNLSQTHSSQIQGMQDNLRQAEETRSRLEIIIGELQATIQQSNAQLINERSASQRLQARLQDVDFKLKTVGEANSSFDNMEKLRSDNSALSQQIDTLKLDIQMAKDAQKRLVDEVVVARSTVQRAQTETRELNQARMGLEQQLQHLNGRIDELKADIASCWMHNFRSWVGKIIGRSKHKAAPTSKGHAPTDVMRLEVS